MNNFSTTIKRSFRSEWAKIAFLILAMLAGRSSLADHYFVPTGSMEYSLMPGDRVLVDKTAYGIRIPFTKIELFDAGSPAAGDIVVFDSPEDGKLLIKRIVAVEGDRVDLIDGRLWVDRHLMTTPGRPFVEEYGARIARLNLEDGGGPDIRGLSIPTGFVLVLGDHRGNSHDGRYFGLIAERELYGRASVVYFSRRNGFQWETL